MNSVSIQTLFNILEPKSFFLGQSSHFEGICDHSSQAEPGLLFFVLPSAQKGPEGYLDLALMKGVTGIVADHRVALEKQAIFSHITFFGVKNPHLALTRMVSALYNKRPQFMAAVTGTNGKTSVTSFAFQLWSALKKPAAALGTLGLQTDRSLTCPPATVGNLTTLEPVALYTTVQTLKEQGTDYLALEASSHGLAQNRLDGLSFGAGVFTSFSQDHLDYHKNMRSYWMTKLRLFQDLIQENGVAIVNDALPHPYELREAFLKKDLTAWTYGFDAGSVCQIIEILPWRKGTQKGQKVRVRLFEEETSFVFPLLGRFQVENVLAAILLVHASGVPLEDILPHTEHLSPAEGRLEHIADTPQGACIYVDYAHTPHALEQVLQELKPLTKKRLIVVFGCGGDRDPSKRPLMGAVAQKNADCILVTDDNPRFEKASAIRQEILAGAPTKARSVPGRSNAIKEAISMLKKGDVLLIAGKGHEKIQSIQGKSLPFDDKRAVKNILQDLDSLVQKPTPLKTRP